MLNLVIGAIALYGLVMLAGGIAGYMKGGSKISLLSGGGSGLLLLGAWLWAKSEPLGGLSVAAVIALALVVVFAKRWRTTGQWKPAGILCGVSGVALVIFGSGLLLA